MEGKYAHPGRSTGMRSIKKALREAGGYGLILANANKHSEKLEHLTPMVDGISAPPLDDL